MTEKRINELDSTLQHCDSGNSMSNDLDSSRYALRMTRYKVWIATKIRSRSFSRNDEWWQIS